MVSVNNPPSAAVRPRKFWMGQIHLRSPKLIVAENAFILLMTPEIEARVVPTLAIFVTKNILVAVARIKSRSSYWRLIASP